jgi:hypothetical protein
VFVGCFVLTCWLAWRWFLAPSDGSDWRDAAPFSLRNPRDVVTMVVIFVVTVGGGVIYVGYKLVRSICGY